MKTKTIKTETRSVTVKKLPLGKYADLLEAMEKLPQNLAELEGVENEQMLPMLPKLIARSLPDVINIICVASDLTPEEIDKMGLDEVVEIVVGIIEVNNYKKVVENIKKLTARQSNKQPKTE